MADKSPQMLSHYVGSFQFIARGYLEYGDYEGADSSRRNLLSKLRGLHADSAVTSCIDYLEKTSWKTHPEVDNFVRYSEGLIRNQK